MGQHKSKDSRLSIRGWFEKTHPEDEKVNESIEDAVLKSEAELGEEMVLSLGRVELERTSRLGGGESEHIAGRRMSERQLMKEELRQTILSLKQLRIHRNVLRKHCRVLGKVLMKARQKLEDVQDEFCLADLQLLSEHCVIVKGRPNRSTTEVVNNITRGLQVLTNAAAKLEEEVTPKEADDDRL